MNRTGKKNIRKFLLFAIIGIYALSFILISINYDMKIVSLTGKIISEEERNEEEIIEEEAEVAFIKFIIPITNAEHLNKNRISIKNIYNALKGLDNVWSEEISDGEYIRADFEENLTDKNDITIYPKITKGDPKIEVYEANKDKVIAEFNDIVSEKYNRVYLTNLKESQNIFDLLVLGGSLQINYIFDPQIWSEDCVDLSDWTVNGWSGDPCAASNGASENMTRGPSDVSSATSMNISFDWTASKIDSDEYIKLFISSDGSTYTNEWTKVGTGATSESGSENINITSYISSSVYIRFECKSGGGEGCNVDNINLGTVAPDSPPKYYNPSVDDATPAPAQTVSHRVYWSDDNAMSFAKLEINSTGAGCDTTANISLTTLSGSSSWANLSWTVPNACEGKTISWKQYANDSANQWNSSMALQTYTVNNINPLASFGTNPVAYYNSTSKSVTFELKVSDNLNVNGLKLYGNWTGTWHANQTNSTPINNSIWSIQVDNIPEGKKHIWAVWGNDTIGNNDWTDTNRSLTVDITAPSVSDEGANETNITQNNYFCLNATVTDSLAGVDTVYAEVWNTASWVNYTMSEDGTTCDGTASDGIYGVKIQGTAQGIWNYSKVYANDTFNNLNAYDFTDLEINVTAPADTTYPQFSNFQTSTANNSVYSFGQSYQLNSTITNTNGTVFLNWDGTNYSASNFSSEFYADFGSLSAGTYSYYWWGYGNGSNKNYNSSSTKAYTVQKAAPAGSLTNSDPWTVTYPEEITIGLSESNNGDDDVTYKIYRDGADKGSGETITLGADTYNYVLNTTGGVNYTSNASMHAQTLTVNQNTGACQVLFNETSPVTYPARFKVWTNCTSAFTLYQNGTSIGNNSQRNLSASSYNFTVIRTDNANYSNTYDEQTFVVQKATGIIYTYINNQRDNQSILLNNEKWLNATLTAGAGNIKLYYNNSLINLGISPLANLTNFTQTGSFNVTGFYSGNANYTRDSETWWATVSTDSAPTINIFYPANITYNSDVIQLNYTVSDDISLSSCWYSTDNGATNTTITCGTNITGLTSSENSNTWRIYANDSINQMSSDSVTFTKDTVYPLISFTTGTEDNATTLTRTWIFVNVSVTETNEHTIIFSLYNSTEIVNKTLSFSGKRTINWTGLPNEDYRYNVSVNDTGTNINFTKTRYITLDTQGPSVSGLSESPSDPATYSESALYQFNATVTDPSLDTVIIEFDGTNYSTTNPSGNIHGFMISNLAVGTYNYRWYANDSFGNLNGTKSGDYTISKASPSLNLIITPSTSETYGTETTATGSGCSSQLTCNLYKDGVLVSNPHTATLGVNVYNYTYNTTGNVNYTSHINTTNLTISKATGVVYVYLDNSRANKTIEQNTIIYLNATLETGSGIIKLYSNGTLINQGTSPLSNLTNFSSIYHYNITGFYPGNENYTSDSETWWVNATEADTTAPNLKVAYPANTSYDSVQAQLNYTVSDNIEVSECWYSTDNGTTNISITCGQNVTGLDSGQGSSTWIVYANDSKGNENSSSVTFFVDSINPVISFAPPTETSGSSLKRNYIQINTTSSDTNLDRITIRLYNSTSLVYTNVSSASPFFVNYTGLSAETYYFNATANDTIGNSVNTLTRSVSLVVPSLAIVLPENETYIHNESIKLNYTVSYENSVWYNIDNGENTTITGNTTFNTSSGSRILYLYANNSNGEVSDSIGFTVNFNKFKIYYGNYHGGSRGSSTNFNTSSYEDLQNVSGVIIEDTNYGKIKFNEEINLTADSNFSDNEIDIDSYINISSNRIEINSTVLPNFNKSATLYLYGLGFSNPRILRDGSVCPSTICTQQSYSGGILTFNVTRFTVYSAEETPSTPTTPSGGGGESGGGIYECETNDECSGNEVCVVNKCVKLFDIKIVNFESPVKLGEFFEFTYFLKGMAEINNDVQINFWIEKQGVVVTSGSDAIYLGNFEEKTETTKIFLPKNTESGIYEFFVEIDYGNYQASSYRTIEIEVGEGGFAGIARGEITQGKKFEIPIEVIIIVLLLMALSGGRGGIQKGEGKGGIGEILGSLGTSRNQSRVMTGINEKIKTEEQNKKQLKGLLRDVKGKYAKEKKYPFSKPITHELKKKIQETKQAKNQLQGLKEAKPVVEPGEKIKQTKKKGKKSPLELFEMFGRMNKGNKEE